MGLKHKFQLCNKYYGNKKLPHANKYLYYYNIRLKCVLECNKIIIMSHVGTLYKQLLYYIIIT